MDEKEDLTKVLGVSWLPSADHFTFNFDPEIANCVVNTPRELVSIQARLYDPDGFIVPFKLPGRRMLQLCKAGERGWDSPLEGKLKKEFEEWASSIPKLAQYSIPRWWNVDIDEDDIVDEQLHFFSDASAIAIGAVGYRRIVGKNGEIRTVIVRATTSAVPLNSARASHHNSIPRLEMAAAEKSIQIRQFVERAVKRKYSKIVMWTDSESVLKMLYDRSRRYQVIFQTAFLKSTPLRKSMNGVSSTLKITPPTMLQEV